MPDCEKPCFLNPDMSASGIAVHKYRSFYNVFGLPCCPGGYIPNIRVRELLESYQALSEDLEDDVYLFENSLRTNLKSLHTWSFSTGGSESKICDPNLRWYLDLINQRVGVCNTFVRKDGLPFNTVLSKQTTKTEHRIQWGNYVLIASEAKSVDSSQYAALVQGMALGGDSSVHMWRCGLSTELAVSPVILSFSDCFCIFAVYLIPHCYPVIVQLSLPLSYLTFEGRCCLACWGIVLAGFAAKTVNSLKQLRSSDKPSSAALLGLYIAPSLFYKPLRLSHKDVASDLENVLDGGSSLRATLESMMRVYQRLHAISRANSFFLFPLGVVLYPNLNSLSYGCGMREIMEICVGKHFPLCCEFLDYGCPVVVYEELNADDWKNTKPPPDAAEAYVNGVKKAVEIMNQAEVAHMDLRPANIMWRSIKENESDTVKVDVRVIDLEDAVPFGFGIQCVNVLRQDPRYPVSLEDEREFIQAAQYHNDWFAAAVEGWALQVDYNRFEDFMNENSEFYSGILKNLTTEMLAGDAANRQNRKRIRDQID